MVRDEFAVALLQSVLIQAALQLSLIHAPTLDERDGLPGVVDGTDLNRVALEALIDSGLDLLLKLFVTGDKFSCLGVPTELFGVGTPSVNMGSPP